MSEIDTPRPPGSLALAWIGAALATGLCMTVLFLGLVLARSGAVGLTAAAWVPPYFFAAAAVEMLAFVMFMGLVETGNTPRSGRAWLVGGLVATCPLALFCFGIANLGDRMEGAAPFYYETLWVPALILAAGVAGAATGFRIRHRNWP